MQINFTTDCCTSEAVVVGVFEGQGFEGRAAKLAESTDGLLNEIIQTGNFKGKKGQTVSVLAQSSCKNKNLIVVIGLGKKEKFTKEVGRSLGGDLTAALNQYGIKEAVVILDPVEKYLERVAFGAKLRNYRFDKYKTIIKEDDKSALETLYFLCDDVEHQEKKYAEYDSVSEGVYLARDLMNEPANVLYPETFAEECVKLSSLGVKVTVLDEEHMQELGMNALLGVGKGSEKKSKLVVMEYQGCGDCCKNRPVALVGKGVTFDTGGISMKPSQDMHEMKGDMGGAAAVVGAVRALAGRKAKINLVGIIGLVENMPSGSAQLPGDIVKSMSGQTIEVLNTDAEGRLVLADALYYAKTKFNPRAIIDLATLTGAIVVCLGDKMAGLFSNDDDLAEKIFSSGEQTGEKVWRFPLSEEYDKMMDSDIADVKNISEVRGGGSITAAQFLQRFIGEDTVWAHIDIAGVDWIKKDRDIIPRGSVGFGVRLINKLFRDHYEDCSE